MTREEIIASYAPYHTFGAFKAGLRDYGRGHYTCPACYRGVDEQAWDRGMEAAMRIDHLHLHPLAEKTKREALAGAGVYQEEDWRRKLTQDPWHRRGTDDAAADKPINPPKDNLKARSYYLAGYAACRLSKMEDHT